MEAHVHTLNNLFAQLGLGEDEKSIQKFIASHGPLPAQLELFSAPFWSASQAKFLREQIANDADWAEVIDQLDSRLR